MYPKYIKRGNVYCKINSESEVLRVGNWANDTTIENIQSKALVEGIEASESLPLSTSTTLDWEEITEDIFDEYYKIALIKLNKELIR